jgi:hypothetical protein
MFDFLKLSITVNELKVSIKYDENKDGIFSYEHKIINYYQGKLDNNKEKYLKLLTDISQEKNSNNFQKSVINFIASEDKITNNFYKKILKYRDKIKKLFEKEKDIVDKKNFYQSLEISKSQAIKKLFLYSNVPGEISSSKELEAFYMALEQVKNKNSFDYNIVINSYVDTLIESANKEVVQYYQEVISKKHSFASTNTAAKEEIILKYQKMLSVYIYVFENKLQLENINFDNLIQKLTDGIKYTHNPSLYPTNEMEAKIFKDMIFETNIQFISTLGALTQYENVLRDKVQEKIDQYGQKYGMQYNYIKDYEQNYSRNINEYHDVYDQRLIESNGKVYERTMYNEMTASIDFYRSLITNVCSDSEQEIIKQYSGRYPLLKYNFRTRNNGVVSEDLAIEAAVVDSENHDLNLNKPTPFLLSIHSIFIKKLNGFKQEIAEKINNYDDMEENLEKFVVELFNEYKMKEKNLISEYNHLVSLYLKDLSNLTKEIDINIMKNPIESIFSSMHYIDFDIVQHAKKDAKLKIASKVFPDYTDFEKSLQEKFQLSIVNIKNNLFEIGVPATIVDNIVSEQFDEIKLNYESCALKYRNIYSESTEESRDTIFKLDVLPFYKNRYDSYFDISSYIAAALYSAINKTDPYSFIYTLKKEAMLLMFKNYEKFANNEEYSHFGIFDPEYTKFTLIEESIIIEYESAVKLYIRFYSNINNDEEVFSEEKLSNFIIVDKYFTYIDEIVVDRRSKYDKYILSDEQKNCETIFVKELLTYYKKKMKNFLFLAKNESKYMESNNLEININNNKRKRFGIDNVISAHSDSLKNESKVHIGKYYQQLGSQIDIETINMEWDK